MRTALIVIDIQNDYFPGGAFPLWNAGPVLDATVTAIARAKARGESIVLVQHVSASSEAGFFRPGSTGAAIHERILAAAPDAPVVVKQFADSFHQTSLGALLAEVGATHLRIAGMMTQNCVAFTAVSPGAARYRVSVLSDCTTTVDEAIHGFALHALSTRVEIGPDA
ncbi:isochorismatase family protein [Pseudoxanthomonas sp. Root630]|uniref:isochorismatase family protein n=1 Tax=Pseudoxanthomonas sp. Root630 TaxID=1736574 RepID=UPI000703BD8E|nr:isochorismatase family protein [Pseudoxanthomonas sp. Root630]KRA51529.1 isochorismatase [Pseudoxanthomonas sp. Root630]